jgi:hypothetical protein
VKSTCKVDGTPGVELGEYVVILDGGILIVKDFEGAEPQYTIEPDEGSTEIEVDEELQSKADDINEQMAAIKQFSEDNDGAEVSTAIGEYDEEDEA